MERRLDPISPNLGRARGLGDDQPCVIVKLQTSPLDSSACQSIEKLIVVASLAIVTLPFSLFLLLRFPLGTSASPG